MPALLMKFPSYTYAQRGRAFADAAEALFRLRHEGRDVTLGSVGEKVEEAVRFASDYSADEPSAQLLVDAEREVLARLGWEE